MKTKDLKKTKPAKPQMSELEDLTKKFEELKTDTAVGTFLAARSHSLEWAKAADFNLKQRGNTMSKSTTAKPVKKVMVDGVLHSETEPALIYSDGNEFWYRNGLIHRPDGPAMTYANGTKAWIQNGLPHREDGPAIEMSSGEKEFYLNGVKVTEADLPATA